MKLVAYGDIGEHGRNCFLIQGNLTCFLLDAGTGGSGELPSLPSEVIPPCTIHCNHAFTTSLLECGAIVCITLFP